MVVGRINTENWNERQGCNKSYKRGVLLHGGYRDRRTNFPWSDQ